MVCGFDCCSLKWQLFVIIVLFVSFFIFKNPPNNQQIVSKFFQDISFIGHRGSPEKAPENTFISLSRTVQDGVNTVEIDVSLTKDNIPILLHDKTLDRTTNFSGLIENYLLSELSNCDTRKKFNGTNLPSFISLSTLEKVIKWSITSKVKIILDVKNPKPAMMDAIIKLFEQYDIYESVVVGTSYFEFLYLLKRRVPKIMTALIWCEWKYSFTDCSATKPSNDNYFTQKLMEIIDKLYFFSVQTWLPSFIGTNILLVDRSFISDWYVKLQKSNSRQVCAWTVNDKTEILWMRKVLNIPVITDRPYLINILN